MAPDNTGPFYLTANNGKIVFAVRIPLGGIRAMRSQKFICIVKNSNFSSSKNKKSSSL